VILMREPGKVTGPQHSFKRNNSLLRESWVLSAQQESDRLAWSEATCKKLFGNSTHL
jgi:hypothetical protein